MEHPFKVEDALDVFKEVSSVNSAWQVLTAMNTGSGYLRMKVIKEISEL